ncbi:MAG TPA: hypothetical protein VKV29_01490 [Chthonomonas sp.]|uniref:hypothetical protein n=1 Tax=Chthonomonas sp. TaxID=2282153 RepID=UPI002B4AE695|nr:hypothetical protein [Chthonomonas sp.]HLH78935.1 hypothetical protein [Chthonomonas sp.]
MSSILGSQTKSQVTCASLPPGRRTVGLSAPTPQERRCCALRLSYKSTPYRPSPKLGEELTASAACVVFFIAYLSGRCIAMR